MKRSRLYRKIAAALCNCCAIGLLAALPPPAVSAERITLRVAAYEDNSHHYYHELLINSLEAVDCQTTLVIPAAHLPQKRAVKMLENGELSLLWLIQTADRDKRYMPVNVGLTNGLIGHRILLIPKNQQVIYSAVRSLEDFRALNKTGGFGKDWFDIKVWEANHLKYAVHDGEWRRLYKMIAAGNRGIDYFSRGFTEVLAEAKRHPYLDIEQRLVLIYHRDFVFYLGQSARRHKDIIEKALARSKETGLMDRLIRRHWGSDFQGLKFDQRVKINLKTPR